jgi:integrase
MKTVIIDMVQKGDVYEVDSAEKQHSSVPLNSPKEGEAPGKAGKAKTERTRRARGTGGVYKVEGSKYWRISYQLNGRLVRESTGEEKKTEAAKKLAGRLKEIGNGDFMGPELERIPVDELYQDLLQDYRIKNQTVVWAERVWNVHLKGSFSGMRASNVGTKQIAAYVERRITEKAAKSTINRELALLRRAFTIAYLETQPRKALRVPNFHKYIVSEKGNERRGFVKQAQYEKLAGAASRQLWLRTLLALGYTFGFRKAELLGMRCSQVDLLDNTITLYAGETKNDESRKVVMTEECRKLVTEMRRGKQPEDYLITRANGEPVKDFREAWDALVEASGVPGLLFHDLRRSAVRNMVRRGVNEKVARGISGHKTRSVFDRYNIDDEEDIRDAAIKIEAGAKNVIHSQFTPERMQDENDDQVKQ